MRIEEQFKRHTPLPEPGAACDTYLGGAFEPALDADYEAARDKCHTLPSKSDHRRSPLTVSVAAIAVLFTTQMTSVIPLLGQLHLAKLITVATIVFFLSSRRQLASRVRLRTVPQLSCLLGMLLLAIATAPFSFWPSQSLSYILDLYAKNIILVYLMVQAMRSDPDTRFVVGALIGGCTLQVVMMIAGFGPLITYKSEPYRIGIGGSHDPNDLALLLVIIIPFAFFMLKGSRLFTRILLLLSIALMLLGIVKTGSRGGFLGLIVIGTLIIMRGSAQARQCVTPSKYVLLTIATGVILFAVAAPPAYWERIKTIFNPKDDYNLTDKAGRLMIWETGVRMIISRPLTGVGISCFPIAHGQYTGSKLHISPHNSFLQVTAELGIIGLILFVAIIFISLRAARFIRRRAREDLLWLASATEISFIGFAISASFLTHAYTAIFCFLVGMGAALRAQYEASKQSMPERR
jgi:O-antigen ligase